MPDPDDHVQLSRIGIVPLTHPAIRTKSAFVDASAPAVKILASLLLSRMKTAEGVGLAANQVAVPVRVFVTDQPALGPHILVNAVVVEGFGRVSRREGCLSLALAGSQAMVDRHECVVVHGQLLDGRRVVVEAREYLAQIYQHEIDHLDGVEYIQRLVGSERERVYSLLANAHVPMSDFTQLELMGVHLA